MCDFIRLVDERDALREALLQIVSILGPVACRCEGQQEEVTQALAVARRLLHAEPAAPVAPGEG